MIKIFSSAFLHVKKLSIEWTFKVFKKVGSVSPCRPASRWWRWRHTEGADQHFIICREKHISKTIRKDKKGKITHWVVLRSQISVPEIFYLSKREGANIQSQASEHTILFKHSCLLKYFVAVQQSLVDLHFSDESMECFLGICFASNLIICTGRTYNTIAWPARKRGLLSSFTSVEKHFSNLSLLIPRDCQVHPNAQTYSPARQRWTSPPFEMGGVNMKMQWKFFQNDRLV